MQGLHAELSGLTSAEAYYRLEQFGPNELAAEREPSAWRVARDVLREPMFLLLLCTGLIYMALGDEHEAIALLVGIFAIIIITYYQQRKTEHALAALRNLSSPRALAIRDGEVRRIPGRELVPGDVVILEEGARIPADGFVLSETTLEIDESSLTGESLPVRKSVWDGHSPMTPAGGSDLASLYSGTLVVQGRGTMLVAATGSRTELGKIGTVLSALKEGETLLQRQTRRLIVILAVLGMLLCLAVAVVYAITRGNWLRGMLAGLTLAIAMIPEEFAVVLSVFFALGAWRIAQANVLTRHTAALEALGAARVLCVDKTGTLTENRMSVAQAHALSENCTQAEVLRFGALACQERPVDPTDLAFLESAKPLDAPGWERVREYPLKRDLLVTAQAWRRPNKDGYLLASKGAPEAILRICRADVGLEDRTAAAVRAMASQGLRVLATAKAELTAGNLPENIEEIAFTLLGIVGLADPVRPRVPQAVQECRQAGIRVVMITGDYAVTAERIGREIGLDAERCLSGPEISSMADDEVTERVRDVSIFARVMPQQKLRLVQALKACGAVVAMTGDGVNDAPALKAADIGIAMGQRGTDVAREAADLVLLDDNFTSIVRAVRTGRRIFDNLKKATAYIFALHVPIAGMSFLPVLIGWPQVLLPVHVVFLELVTDPACSVAFEAEPEEADVMTRPPRNPHEPLLTRGAAVLSFLQGLSILSASLAVYALCLHQGGEPRARALAFSALVAGDVSLMFVNRSFTRTAFALLRTQNRSIWWITAGTAFSLTAMLYTPLRSIFQFGWVDPAEIIAAAFAGGISVGWFELLKMWRRKAMRPTLAR